MNIAIIGELKQVNELLTMISLEQSNIQVFNNANEFSGNYNYIFDLTFEKHKNFKLFIEQSEQAVIFINAVFVQLEECIPTEYAHRVIGINALPTFIQRNTLEYCTLLSNPSVPVPIFKWQKWEKVQSRIGMVTPRVIAMIINEAYFTLQEGTANRKDIDIALKLGTAYPYGPFEWCERIGIINVYNILYSIQQDTHDDRYKICSLLKTEYLQACQSQ